MSVRLLYCNLVLPFVMFSCEKRDVRNSGQPDRNDDAAVTAVWRIPADSSGQFAIGREPIVWENKVIWGNATAGKGFEVILSDGRSGSEIWRWSDFIKYPDLPYQNYHFVDEHYYCFNNIQETHVIDLFTGKTVWSYFDPNAGAYICEAGDYLYGKQNDRDYRPQTCRLRRTSLASLTWETLVELNADKDSGYSPAIFGPSLWVSPNADSLLIFQNRSWNFSTGKGKIDFCAFDMSNDSMYFKLPDIESSQNSNVLRPLVDGNRAYLAGQKNLHCVDLENRRILWQKGFPGAGHHLMLSNLVIEGERLIVKADDDRIYGFNKYSGQLLWATANAGASPSHMKLAGQRVYYVSEADAHIYGVNIADGSVQVRIRSPNEARQEYPGAGFHGGLAVNEQLGLIYAHDHHFFMGIKIP